MGTTSILTIDRAAIAENYRILKAKAGAGVDVAGVVKANAYGLGFAEIVAILEAQNCPIYFVANLPEAMALRALTAKPIAVLGGITSRDDLAEMKPHQLWPVINSPTQLALVPIGTPFILHLDTGMNRLGFSGPELDHALQNSHLQGHDIRYVMSHFACADEKDHALTEMQSARFAGMASKLDTALNQSIPRSLANSSGIYRSNVYHHHLVRPGMALYGLNPTPEVKNPMKPVVTLEAPVLQVRKVRTGETIGYGATHTFTADSITATIALGYADGFSRASSNNRAQVFWRGHPCPVIGRVSMDLVTIDLSGLPGNVPPPGLNDLIEVLGAHQDADTLAARIGTIGYEILTQLSGRAKRLYK